MSEPIFQRTREDARTRLVPFVSLNVAATSASDLFATVTGNAMRVARLTACNTTGTAATLTLHVVPDGSSIADSNAELVGYSIAANDAVDLTDLIGGLYGQNAEVRVWSDTANAITLSGYFEDVF